MVGSVTHHTISHDLEHCMSAGQLPAVVYWIADLLPNKQTSAGLAGLILSQYGVLLCTGACRAA